MNGRRCLACERSDEEVPLVRLVYRGEEIWICPGHMPVLIHDPARLADRLPGAEALRPAEKHPPPAARRRAPR
jgi:hypothetical protein